jgi:hypothetical protein
LGGARNLTTVHLQMMMIMMMMMMILRGRVPGVGVRYR